MRRSSKVPDREPDGVEPWLAMASFCYAVAWHPGGDLLATGHRDGSVRLLALLGSAHLRMPVN